MIDPRKSRRWLLALGSLGVVAGVLLGRSFLDQLRQVSAPSPEELAKPHLDRAQKESERRIDEHVKVLDAFFADSKERTRAFADEALGFRSKLLLASEGIRKAAQQAARMYMEVKDSWFRSGFPSSSTPIDPLALAAEQVAELEDDRHKAFIRERFEEYVFKPSQLEDAVQQVVRTYLADVRSIESKMLVDLRTDVADFPSAYVLARFDERKVQAVYDEAISRAIEATGGGLRADIANELVVIIASDVLTQVAVRLGVSAGILGTGAATGWATVGIGFVVGLIIDQIVSWVLDWWADARGDLARELDTRLDEIHRLIVDGSNDVKGLRSRLQEFARERAGFRRQAVLALLQPQTGGTR